MIRFFLLLLLPFALSASSILSYNIYDRTDRVDVMITFDTPYTGTIKQSVSTQNIIIKLEDAKIESAKTKKLSSNFLNAVTITPMAGYTQIVASVPPSVELQASKTADSYGLRLRFTNSVSQSKPKQQPNVQEEVNPFASLPTKQDGDMSQSYYIVISILVAGIVLLFYLKKKMNTSQQAPKKSSSWLFKADAKHNVSSNEHEVSIRFQKTINNENSVVMLDFGAESYLVLMGHNNILLDKFTDNKPVTQSDFETILQNRHQELDDFLKVDKKGDSQEPLQSYKEKASSISYDV